MMPDHVGVVRGDKASDEIKTFWAGLSGPVAQDLLTGPPSVPLSLGQQEKLKPEKPTNKALPSHLRSPPKRKVFQGFS